LTGAAGASVTFTVHAAGATAASDVDTLVIFRDGFNLPNGDGAQALMPSPDAIGAIAGGATQIFTLPASQGNAIEDVQMLRAGNALLRVQSVTFGTTTWVRVLTETDGRQSSSAWSPAHIGDTLTIGSFTGNGQRLILLEGAESSLTVPLTK